MRVRAWLDNDGMPAIRVFVDLDVNEHVVGSQIAMDKFAASKHSNNVMEGLCDLRFGLLSCLWKVSTQIVKSHPAHGCT